MVFNFSCKNSVFEGMGALFEYKNDKKVPKKGTKKSTQPRKNSEVLHEKLKIVLPMGILKKKLKKNPEPQLHQMFKPIRKFFCTFLPIWQFKLKKPLYHIKVSSSMVKYECIDFLLSIRMMMISKKFFKLPHICLAEHARCQLPAVGTTRCGEDFYY